MDYRKTLMWKELNEYGAAIAAARENRERFEELAREIERRGVCGFVGAARGTSDHALVLFKYLTEIFSPYTVGLAACSTVTKYGGKVNYGKHAVIGVSQSGRAADVLAVIERAKADGALTIAITNDEKSPLALAADHSFCLRAGEEKSVAATKTFTAQCYLLMQLAAAVSGSETLLNALDAIPSSIERNREAIERISDELSDVMKDAEDGFILARGLTYALALEGALKLQETSYIRMKGYADSDFMHGPMAMVGQGTKIIALAPAMGLAGEELERERVKELRALYAKLKAQGASLEIVSPDEVYAESGRVHLLGGENEAVSFFSLALLLQMTACKTSCKRGNDPDSPRALNKVTVTV